MNKVIIAGGRDFNNGKMVIDAVSAFQKIHGEIDEIVCGMCKGADMMGCNYARIWNIPVKEFPADWNKHGRSAGIIRNKEMAKYASGAIIFWDGSSKGTRSMISLAEKYKLNTNIILYKKINDYEVERK